MKYYSKDLTNRDLNVIDIDLSGLPKDCDESKVKRAAKVKHVVSTEVKYDNLHGTCLGEGRIKIRLNEGETFEQVRENLQAAGFNVRTHHEDPRKRPIVTGEKKDIGEHHNFNPKDKKVHELTTKFSNILGDN